MEAGRLERKPRKTWKTMMTLETIVWAFYAHTEENESEQFLRY
jgi:hypothetical protein